MSDWTYVRYEVMDAVGIVSLNRPDKLNALNATVRRELTEALRRADQDGGVRAVILRGEGRAFCAGADLADPESVAKNPEAFSRTIGTYIDLSLAVWDLTKPVIAAVHGYALGAGCDLSLMCDLTVAAEDAEFGEPEIRFQSTPPTLMMPYVVGMKRMKELLFTGDRIPAREAQQIGLVNRVVPAERLLDEAMRLARKLAKIPPVAMRLNKQSINRIYEMMGLRAALRAHAEVSAVIESAPTPEREAFERACLEKGVRQAARELLEQFDAE